MNKRDEFDDIRLDQLPDLPPRTDDEVSRDDEMIAELIAARRAASPGSDYDEINRIYCELLGLGYGVVVLTGRGEDVETVRERTKGARDRGRTKEARSNSRRSGQLWRRPAEGWLMHGKDPGYRVRYGQGGTR